MTVARRVQRAGIVTGTVNNIANCNGCNFDFVPLCSLTFATYHDFAVPLEEKIMPNAKLQNANILSLDANQALSVKAAQLRVESGIVWLTQSGQPDDVLLFAGQSFKAQRCGRIVIQSLAAETRVSWQPRSLFSGIAQRLAATRAER
jgi:hypothetical protein